MKLIPKSLALPVAVAALALAGCSKKPDRPYPGSTVLGPQNGPAAPADASFGQNTTGLVDRGSDFDPNGHNRTALQGQTVLFDFDKSDVRASEREKLKVAKEYLDKNPAHRLLLEGHCDWRGTAEYTLGLGDRRAAAVRKYLQSIGVPADRLETLSKGSLEASKNADEATMAKDRRVSLVVVNPSAAAPKAF
ncbi:MAG: OmpA family protein [Opitutaceae bacterium]